MYPLNPKKVISIVVRQQTPPEEQQNQLQIYKTPGSTRSLRRTFRRLQDKGKVHPDAAVLLRAGEKFATSHDLVRHENIGLRKAILYKKQRRKRGKAMNLYDDDEKEGQGRFFSPAKVARARERTAAAADAQLQHQLAVRDKKLQMATLRAEKARETEERKQQRQIARQIAREQLAIEKAERLAVREAQRVRKAAATTRRIQDVAERRTQRVRAKEAKLSTARLKKRSLEEDEENRPRKRVRIDASRIRSAAPSRASSIVYDTRTIQSLTAKISSSTRTESAVRTADQLEDPILISQRSRRALRLPTRFR